MSLLFSHPLIHGSSLLRSARQLLTGDDAKKQKVRKHEDTVFDAKWLIGRSDVELWPFTVVFSSGDKSMIQAQITDDEKKFHSEEVSSMVLTKMRKKAETYLDTKKGRSVSSRQ